MRGLDGKYLETKDDQIEMGLDNRAFILDYAMDDTTYWAYWHYYLGGTLQFDVDVSSVGCECAAGVYLVELNDDYCSWDSKSRGETPQCATIDVMEANQHGFKTQSLPCEFGVCDEESQCSASANAAGTMKYGSGSEYLINTKEKYSVKTQFMRNEDDLECIKTTLIQGANEHSFDQNCADYLQPLSSKLQEWMAMAISTYHVGLENNISNQVCTDKCSALDTKTVISNVRWTKNDAFYDPEDEDDGGNDGDMGEIMVGGPAPTLTSGNCTDECSQCMEHFYENAPADIWYQCVDTTIYKFGNVCNKPWHDTSMCATTGHCHKSYPHGDPEKMNSEFKGCRTIPDKFLEGDFKFGRRDSWSPTCGLCKDGCGDGTCHNSWLRSDPEKWRSASAMCRCKPAA